MNLVFKDLASEEYRKKEKINLAFVFSQPGGGGTKEIVKARFECKSNKKVHEGIVVPSAQTGSTNPFCARAPIYT